jgi:Fe-S-cluster containining protein
VRVTRAALAILQEADALLDGWTCESSTECCRFSVTGREPYVTRAEWALIVAEVKRQGRKLPAVPDSDDGRCAFLDDAGQCRVYAVRPLGCRTFFCERAHGPNGEHTREIPKREIQQLARDLSDASDGEKARPLRSYLAR